jgi:hypothetical protein
MTVPPEIVRWLADRGADKIDHPGGKLLDHLVRTATLLSDWGAEEYLVLAGLCHAVYGTEGFPHEILPPTERETVRQLVGVPAEHAIYVYGSSRQAPAWTTDDPATTYHVDRFTDERRTLTDDEQRDFWSIQAANDIDLLPRIANMEISSQHARANVLLARSPWIPEGARAAALAFAG